MLKNIFRYNPERLRRINKYIITLALLPVALGGTIAFLILVTNLRAFVYTRYFFMILTPILVAVPAAGVICFASIYKIEKRLKRNYRHTFIEIGLYELVYSQYEGDFFAFGRLQVLKKMTVAEFSCVKTIEFDPKNESILIRLSDDGAREYQDEVRRLFYGFQRNRFKFSEWWYNETGYKRITEILIKNSFTDQKQLYHALVEAKSRFDSLPPPKPYQHKELDFVRHKKILRRFQKGR